MCQSMVNGKIPTGCHDIDSINTVLQRQLTELTGEKKTEQHMILSANKNTLHCVLEIKDMKTVVDFDVDNSLRNVPGSQAKQYRTSGRYKSENLVNILSVNSILVHCDIIRASRVNGSLAPVIYNFFPDVSPGEKIVSQAQHISTSHWQWMSFHWCRPWITDQSGEEIDLRGEELTLTLYVRKKKH